MGRALRLVGEPAQLVRQLSRFQGGRIEVFSVALKRILIGHRITWIVGSALERVHDGADVVEHANQEIARVSVQSNRRGAEDRGCQYACQKWTQTFIPPMLINRFAPVFLGARERDF